MLTIREDSRLEEDGEIALREFICTEDDDFLTYVEWLRRPEIIKYIGRKEYLLTTSIESIKEYVTNLANSPNDSLFRIYYKSHFIGTFKIGHINWETRNADMGIMIGDDENRGKGLSVRTMQLGLRYAFGMLGLWKASGGCLSINTRMIKCFESSGFIREGVIRKYMFVEGGWVDHVLYGLLREECKGGS